MQKPEHSLLNVRAFLYLQYVKKQLLILLPALDLDILLLQLAECFDEGTCQTSIGNQWNIMIDGSATNLVATSSVHVSSDSSEYSRSGRIYDRQSSASRCLPNRASHRASTPDVQLPHVR